MSEKKRYIVEAHDYVQMISLIGVRNGNAIMITAPTDKFVTVDGELEKAYQQGLEDMHKAIEKISNMSAEEKEAVFGGQTLYYAINEYTTNGIMEKLAAYEKQQKADEIKVGDEVTPKSNDSNWLGVVVGVDNTNAMVMTRDGYTAMYPLEILKKTNKNFPQVAELLEAMKGEQQERNCSTCKHGNDAIGNICRSCAGYEKWEPKGGDA